MTRRAPRRRPTIDDVARVAGVSRGTVSRYLNGGHWVSPESHAAVEAAVRETGYRPNAHARSLVTARANSVAFLLTESQDRLFADPNFETLMRGAADALAERDVPLVLIMAGTDAEQRRAREFILAGHVDGALLVSSHTAYTRFLGSLLSADVPLISCGMPLGYERRIGWVGSDDLEGAREIVQHLASRGRRRIAHITGPLDTSGGKNRLRGYEAELGDRLDPLLVIEGDYSRSSGERATVQLLERRPDLDAIFASNDLMAAGAMDALKASGRRIPDDVAVAGFDDSPIARHTDPALTTMRQPFERISRDMVRALLEVIEGEPPARINLPASLVVRDST
ncbi:LacI family DNA-binding transcriptional regulator [Microbacterium sp.]|uniref:LacI family DNA-binding transcriptional regulator n=1 Tax=Microbacterium sp. TaxID=51671 RepID=UPI0039E4E877